MEKISFGTSQGLISYSSLDNSKHQIPALEELDFFCSYHYRIVVFYLRKRLKLKASKELHRALVLLYYQLLFVFV